MARTARAGAQEATQQAQEASQSPTNGKPKPLTPAQRRELLKASVAGLQVASEAIKVQRPTSTEAPSFYIEQVAAAYEHGSWVQVAAPSEEVGKIILRELRKALRQLNAGNGTDIRFSEASGWADDVFVVQVKPRDKQDGRGRPKNS